MLKRTVDVVLSLVFLFAALPLLFAAALIIRLSSPGPALFRQTRMGRGFKPFQILKLRTMAHAEGGLAYTLGRDPRITPFGHWLRRTKIDELPQLWNVLRGEMSLVGPRPVIPDLTREFHEDYLLLLRVRPGLTDPASLKYRQESSILASAHDPMRCFKTIVTPDKIRISAEYMERSSLATDLGVMLMTALACCIPSMGRYLEAPLSVRTSEPEEQAVLVPVPPITMARSPLPIPAVPRTQFLVRTAEKKQPPRVSIPWNLLASRSANGQVKNIVSRRASPWL